MTNPANPAQADMLFAEPLLVERLREAVPEFVKVSTASELPRTIEALGTTSQAFVVFEGARPSRSRAGAAATLSAFVYTVAVVVRHGATQESGATQRSIAGPLLSKTYNALAGLRLDGCLPLRLVAGPDVRYYPGGQAIFYLSFELASALFPRIETPA